jgi:hypothetical protein
MLMLALRAIVAAAGQHPVPSSREQASARASSTRRSLPEVGEFAHTQFITAMLIRLLDTNDQRAGERQLEVSWDTATEAESAVLVGWLRNAENPQMRRSRADAQAAGSVRTLTGKPEPRPGYAPPTIAHSLSVVLGCCDWQERWEASGLNERGKPVTSLVGSDSRCSLNMSRGLRSLLTGTSVP